MAMKEYISLYHIYNDVNINYTCGSFYTSGMFIHIINYYAIKINENSLINWMVYVVRYRNNPLLCYCTDI